MPSEMVKPPDLLTKFRDDYWDQALDKLHDATLVEICFSLDQASLTLTFRTLVLIDKLEYESDVVFEFDTVYNSNVIGDLRSFWLSDDGEQPSTSLVYLFEAQLITLSNKDFPGTVEAKCVEFRVEGMYGWHIRFVADDFRRITRSLG